MRKELSQYESEITRQCSRVERVYQNGNEKKWNCTACDEEWKEECLCEKVKEKKWGSCNKHCLLISDSY